MLRKEPISQNWSVSKKVLGKGSFATVRIAKKKPTAKLPDVPDVVAVKIVDKRDVDSEELPLLNDEVEIMARVDHPSCIKLYEMYESSNYLMLVVEMCTGGELFDRIVKRYETGSFSEEEASKVVRQVAQGLKYLHTQGIVHRDLKPENLLYLTEADDADIKITDFGLAKYTQADKPALMTTACGTPGYVAPEIIIGDGYGKEVDLWSLGVITYIILCGFPPFYDQNHAALFQAIRNCRYDFPSPYWDNVSDSAKDLIKKLLVVDAEQRLTADQILQHPWIVAGQDSSTAPHLLGAHVKDGIRALQAKEKWRKAQLRLGVIKALGGDIRKLASMPAPQETKSAAADEPAPEPVPTATD